MIEEKSKLQEYFTIGSVEYRTVSEWSRIGRIVKKGATSFLYIRNTPIFAKSQTESIMK